jgi:phosphatidylglycerophosphate synthase
MLPGRARLLATIPDTLSILRIGLAVSFPLVEPPWRLWIVVGGALSDWLDGLIARRYRVTSFRGSLLDAISDKLFVFAVLMTLTGTGALRWWQAVLVMTRDVTVAGVAAAAALRADWSAFRDMGVRGLGRATTVAQFALFVCLLLPLDAMALPALAAAAGLSLLAAADYMRRVTRVIARRRGGRAPAPGGPA